MHSIAFFASVISLAASTSALAIRADTAPFILSSNPYSSESGIYAEWDPSSSSTSQDIFFSGASTADSVDTLVAYFPNGGTNGTVQSQANPNQVLYLDTNYQLKIGEQDTLSDDMMFRQWQIRSSAFLPDVNNTLVYLSGVDVDDNRLRFFRCSGSDSTEDEVFYHTVAPEGKNCGIPFELVIEYK